MYELFDDYPELMTIDDVRELLPIGRNTAYKLFRTGAIQSKKIGGKWCVTKPALQQYVTENDYDRAY